MSAVFGVRLGDLMGRSLGDLRERLGPPDVERAVGGDRWLLYRGEGVRLRIRCRPVAAPEPRVASWTASFEEGRPTLREAAEPLGLWPACAPDVHAGLAEGPLLRRALRVGSELHSVTARVRDGRIDEITVFDEDPEWEEAFAQEEEAFPDREEASSHRKGSPS